MPKFYSNVQTAGDNILVREIENGKRTNKKIPYNPTLYVKSNKKSQFKNLQGDYVEPIKPGSIRETRDWVKQYEGVSNFEIFGNTQYQYTWIAEEFPEEDIEYKFNQLSVWSLDIESEAEKGFPDIENPNERINLITFKNIQSKEIYTYALPWSEDQVFKTDRKDVHYFEFNDEQEMLAAFLDKWAEVQPDIITGWNVEMFDMVYLIRRMMQFFKESDIRKALSPWGQLRETSVSFMGQDKPAYAISGVSVLDFLRLYRVYNKNPRENYKLGYISELDLEVGKIDHAEYDSFSEFYKGDWQKYVDYNIRDVELVESLNAKWQYIQLAISVAYKAKVNFEDVMSQVRTWDTIIYNELLHRNIVVPMKMHTTKLPYEGAYVKDPLPGMYYWVVALDFTSLYPSLIRILNIGIETKANDRSSRYSVNPNIFLDNTDYLQKCVAECIKLRQTLAVNGICYSKEHMSFYSALIEKFFNLRVEYRKRLKECKAAGDKDGESKYDMAQQAIKILMNSLYGALGNEFFRFFDVDNAEAVTLTGQFVIQYMERGLNEFLNKTLKTKNEKYVVYCDTDSVYITLNKVVKELFPGLDQTKVEVKLKITNYLDKLCNGPLQDQVQKLVAEITSKYINGMDPKLLKMAREVIANKAIWTSKKRYILNVLDSEGEKFGLGVPDKGCKKCTEVPCKKHSVPKLKIMGIEIKKASNPKYCRDRMESAVKMILDDVNDNSNLITFIDETKVEFNKLPVEEIATPKGCNGIGKYGSERTIFKPQTPLHTKGALLYNHYLKEKGLTKKYQFIQEGEKIKYVYLKLPNRIREKVMAFTSEFPKEFGLHDYIDYETQFDKTFMEPLGIILKAIGWKSEKIATLEKWF